MSPAAELPLKSFFCKSKIRWKQLRSRALKSPRSDIWSKLQSGDSVERRQLQKWKMADNWRRWSRLCAWRNAEDSLWGRDLGQVVVGRPEQLWKPNLEESLSSVTPSSLLSRFTILYLPPPHQSHTPLLRLSSGVSPRECGEPLVACGLRCLGWAGSGGLVAWHATHLPVVARRLLAPPGAAI